MMDTSMDDLFSDFERSNHAVADQDHSSADTFVLTERALGEELELRIRRHDSLECALIYTVTLSSGEFKPFSSAEFVCPYSPSSMRLTPTSRSLYTTESTSQSWPVIRPCVLTTGICTRPISMDCSPMLPIISVPQGWLHTLQKCMGLCASSSELSHVVWLIGFPNGMIHQFRLDMKGYLHYKHFFTLPSLDPVSLWNWVDSPVCVDSSSASLQCTEDVLVAVDCHGCGAACWLPPKYETCEGTPNWFQITEFRLPPAPSEIIHTQSHGSWLHFITDTGHICSLHLSYVKSKLDCESDACFWRLVCEPANFPRVPAHVVPTRCLTDDQHLRARWRFYNIQTFTRLSDGHLGGQLTSGEKTRLVDLLCKPEVPDPRSVDFSDNDNLLLAVIASLTETHKRCRTYLNVLRIFRFLNAENEPNAPSDLLPNSDHPGLFSLAVRLTVRTSSNSSSGFQPFDLTITVTPMDHPTALPELQSCCDTLSSMQLMSCLFQKTHRCYVHDLRPRLTVKVSYIPVGIADRENETVSLPLFTYSEPWWDADMLLDPESISRSDWSRCLTLPETWFTCLRQHNLSERSCSLRIHAFLDWEPPLLPAAFFRPGYLLPSSSSFSSYTFPYPPLSAYVGIYDLDMLHWLCPTRLLPTDLKSSIVFSNQNDLSDTNQFTMTYRISSVCTLQTILSDACKSMIDLSNLDDGDSDISVNTETSFHLTFVPTGRVLKLTWKRLSDRQNAGIVHYGSNAILLTISSSCLRTLGWIHQALNQRLKSKVLKSELPCIETLRQEYSVLQTLRSSLQQLKVEQPVTILNDPKIKVQSVLKAFCTVRNTFASTLFSDHR